MPATEQPRVKIETPTDLPAEWHAKYLVLRLRYRKTRLWETDAQADDAAFKDTRSGAA